MTTLARIRVGVQDVWLLGHHLTRNELLFGVYFKDFCWHLIDGIQNDPKQTLNVEN